MSNSPDSPEIILHRPIFRFMGIAILFALLGPVAGALGVNILLSVLAAAIEIARGNMGDVNRLLGGGIIIGTIISLPIAYSFGLVSAVGVGLAVATANQRGHGISWQVAFVWAGVFWLLMAALAMIIVPPGGLKVWLAGLLVAHLLAAALCTLLARRLFASAAAVHRSH